MFCVCVDVAYCSQGNTVYTSYADLEAAYVSKDVHPGDLKGAVTKGIENLLKPVREKVRS